MAEGLGIHAPNVQPTVVGAGPSLPADAPASAAKLPQQSSTSYSAQPTAPGAPGLSKVAQRLIEQNATLHSPGLARIPLPSRPEGVERQLPKKPAGPMGAPRTLDAGRSPLAPGSLSDARASTDAIGQQPDDGGESHVVNTAKAGAEKMPSRHGLVAYTKNSRGDSVYLTQERWLHIRENHMDGTPQPRGKRTTSYWPTQNAVTKPSMTDQDVIGVIVDTMRTGTLRTEVRDTRMAERDLPTAQRDAFGVSEAKVSMAPDGLVLSAYPGAGDNVLAVYEVSPEDQAALAAQQSTSQSAQAADERMFQTNVSATTFG